MTANPEAQPALLIPFDTIAIAASVNQSAVRDLVKRNSKVRFATIWDEFKTRFFDKVEGPCPQMTYRKYGLLKISPDQPIIAELGGDAMVEGPFLAAFALLQMQANGERGHLQTNGYANIFYSRDKKGELCAVRLGWADDGWVMDAISTRDPLAWNGKHQIFCPIRQ